MDTTQAHCVCPIVRHFIDGSTSTADPNGRWVGRYVCAGCGLRILRTERKVTRELVTAALRARRMRAHTLRAQLRALDPTRTGVSSMRKADLEAALVAIALNPTEALLRRVEARSERGHWLDGFNWLEVIL